MRASSKPTPSAASVWGWHSTRRESSAELGLRDQCVGTLSGLREQRAHFRRGLGPPEMVALADLAAHHLEHPGLIGRLEPLGDDDLVERIAPHHHRANDHPGLLVAWQPLHDEQVDLFLVDRQPAELTKQRKTRTEDNKHNSDAEVPELLQRID